MKKGGRLKLLRMLSGYSQQYIADILGVSQKTIAVFEAGRASPRLQAIDLLAKFFGCSRKWLESGKPPAYIQYWGYAEIPSERIVSRRGLNDLDDVLRTLFIDFLRENSVSEYYVVNEKDNRQKVKLYVFPLALPVTYILKCHEEFWGTVDYVISELSLQLKKEISMDSSTIDTINDPLDMKTLPYSVAELHEALEIAKRDEVLSWFEDLRQNDKRNRIESKLYQKRLDEICRTILEYSIDPNDVLGNMKKFCRTKDDYNFVDFWIKKAKEIKKE